MNERERQYGSSDDLELQELRRELEKAEREAEKRRIKRRIIDLSGGMYSRH